MIILAPPQDQDQGQQQLRSAVPETMTWTLTAGWLGRQWTLTDIAGPVVKLEGAILPEAEPDHRWSESATLPGSSWEGSRDPRGEAFIPLMIQGDDLKAFMAASDDFGSALDGRYESVLRVIRMDGQWREIALRYQGRVRNKDLNVVASLLDTFGVTWATADPYWRGEPIPTTFVYADDTPAPDWFEDPAPIDFAPANSLDGATVKNPGDVDSPATWRVTGPFSGFRVGVGAAVVELDYARSAGEWVDIDMSTQARTILDQDGNDLWDFAGDVEMADIPAGDVALTVSIDSPGEGTSATLTFVPGYRRAW